MAKAYGSTATAPGLDFYRLAAADRDNLQIYILACELDTPTQVLCQELTACQVPEPYLLHPALQRSAVSGRQHQRRVDLRQPWPWRCT